MSAQRLGPPGQRPPGSQARTCVHVYVYIPLARTWAGRAADSWRDLVGLPHRARVCARVCHAVPRAACRVSNTQVGGGVSIAGPPRGGPRLWLPASRPAALGVSHGLYLTAPCLACAASALQIWPHPRDLEIWPRPGAHSSFSPAPPAPAPCGPRTLARDRSPTRVACCFLQPLPSDFPASLPLLEATSRARAHCRSCCHPRSSLAPPLNPLGGVPVWRLKTAQLRAHKGRVTAASVLRHCLATGSKSGGVKVSREVVSQLRQTTKLAGLVAASAAAVNVGANGARPAAAVGGWRLAAQPWRCQQRHGRLCRAHVASPPDRLTMKERKKDLRPLPGVR